MPILRSLESILRRIHYQADCYGRGKCKTQSAVVSSLPRTVVACLWIPAFAGMTGRRSESCTSLYGRADASFANFLNGVDSRLSRVTSASSRL